MPGSSGSSRIERLSMIHNSDQHPHCLSPDGDLTSKGIRHSNDGPSTRLCGSGNLITRNIMLCHERLSWRYEGWSCWIKRSWALYAVQKRVLISELRTSVLFEGCQSLERTA
ncbi:hypothetical protein M3J09_004396 [Ascochyta lentis]